ncbi:MAG: DF family (seleno)protein [bacterium]
MKIEILSFAGCPHREPTLERVREVLAASGVDAELAEVEVRDAAEAARFRFPGSPTVRVDGRDIEGDPGDDGGDEGALSCRLYGASGTPPRALIEEAIRRA